MDGDVLLQLYGDFEEFRLLVPKASIRLKIKAIIKKVFSFFLQCMHDSFMHLASQSFLQALSGSSCPGGFAQFSPEPV